MPISNASARLIDGKYQMRTRKYTVPANVEALETRNAIYFSTIYIEGTIQVSDRLLTTHRQICPVACITKSDAKPSSKVNSGVLFVNVQSHGLKVIFKTQFEGVAFVLKALRTEIKITGITAT